MTSRPVTWSSAVRRYRLHASTAVERAEETARVVRRFQRLARRFGSESPEDVTLGQLLRFHRRGRAQELAALLEFSAFLDAKRLL